MRGEEREKGGVVGEEVGEVVVVAVSVGGGAPSLGSHVAYASSTPSSAMRVCRMGTGGEVMVVVVA